MVASLPVNARRFRDISRRNVLRCGPTTTSRATSGARTREPHARGGTISSRCRDRVATSFERNGYLSTTSWLTHRLGVAPSVAAQHVRLARGLEEMRGTRQALEDGEISLSAATALVSAHETDTESRRYAGSGSTARSARRSRVNGRTSSWPSIWRHLRGGPAIPSSKSSGRSSGGGSAAGVRHRDHTDNHARPDGAARGRPPDAGRAGGAAQSGGRARPRPDGTVLHERPPP